MTLELWISWNMLEFNNRTITTIPSNITQSLCSPTNHMALFCISKLQYSTTWLQLQRCPKDWALNLHHKMVLGTPLHVVFKRIPQNFTWNPYEGFYSHRGYQKYIWMVYEGKSIYKMDDNSGYPFSRKPPYSSPNSRSDTVRPPNVVVFFSYVWW